jgi:prepilin-type N-terminal cleavage/methylation domain-containing protein
MFSQNQTKMQNRSGFTLVELLVVITIIAILAGLMLPAVNSARKHARLAECINNQKNLGIALLHCQSVKGAFPPCLAQVVTPVGAAVAATATVSWVVPILPYFDRQDVWEQFRDKTVIQWNGATSAWNVTPGLIKQLTCPGDFEVLTNPPAADAQGNSAPLSYVANLRVCPDHTITSTNNVSLSDLKTASRTPLLGERLTHYNYTDPLTSTNSSCQTGPWYVRTLTAPPTGPLAENVSFQLPPLPPPPPAAQPAPSPVSSMPSPGFISNHPGVVVVTFCDGHTEAITTETNLYDVFDLNPYP